MERRLLLGRIMIPRVQGWSWEWVGESVVLAPQDVAKGVAAILYEERLRPPGPPLELAEAVLGRISGLEVVGVGEVEELVTVEGEHAATVNVRVFEDGQETEYAFGFVYADDSFARLVGCCTDPAQVERVRDTVRRLVLADRQLLGEIRRRPCRHRPPLEWRGRARGFDMLWTSPDRQATITVSPAMPADAVPEAHGAAMSTPAGLHGVEWQEGGAVHARLADGRYAYSVCMEGTNLEEHRLAFLQVVHGIERIPLPAHRQVARQTDVLDYWA
jgi:hypothetical protein